jgi:ATP10 protein
MKPWMSYAIGAVLLALGVVFARSLAQVGVGQVEFKAGDPVKFPNVEGANLEGRKFNLPTDFEAKLNLVAIAFYQNHQELVNTWLPAVGRLTSKHSTLKFYELPTLSKENGLVRGFIDGGMRAGIPNKATREVTITLYLDRVAFLKAIGETSDRTIITLLVNQQGTILWRGRGAYTQAQEDSLEKVLQPKP